MKKKFQSIIKNKDYKALLENFLSLSAIQLINLILPIVVLPYLVTVLGFQKYGTVIFATSLITYFVSLTDYSFKISATRDVAVFRGNEKKINLIYSKVLSIKFILLLFSWIVLGLLILTVPLFKDEQLVFSLTSLTLFGYVVFPDWYFQGIEKMKFIALLNLGIKLFFTAGVFLIIKEPEDYWKYPLLNSLGFVFAGLAGQYLLFKKFGVRYIGINKRILKNNFKSNFPIFINQFLPNLYNNTTTFVLGLLTNANLVGIYDALKKVVDLALMIINVISRVFFPFINRDKKFFKVYMKFMLVFGLFVSMLPVFFSSIIHEFLNIDFHDGLLVLIILSIGVFFYVLYDVFGLNFFIVSRMDKLVMKNTILSSLIGLLTVIPLVYFFDIIGAALNLTLSRFFMGGILAYKYFKMR